MPTSPSAQDYLKTIYHLCQEHPRASTTQIAARLGVTPASVTGMLKRLAHEQPPLVDYRPHRGVRLTPAGQRAALETIRRHRLLELFLHQVLGYPWDEVHAEAERLEHVLSPTLEARIAALLGHPTHDPHGDPIPSPDLELPPDATLPLSRLQPGQRAVVRRVASHDPGLLRHLSRLGLTPGAVLTVAQRTAYDGLLHLRPEGGQQPLVLGPRLQQAVFVEVLP